jgi:hypothetical protein
VYSARWHWQGKPCLKTKNHDFICQNIPLRRLLDLAPQKYPSVRDFETQTVKRLIYFENAEQDVDPAMLQPVIWQAVKEYFIAQASQIGNGWLG